MDSMHVSRKVFRPGIVVWEETDVCSILLHVDISSYISPRQQLPGDEGT